MSVEYPARGRCGASSVSNRRLLVVGNSHTQMIQDAAGTRAKLGQPLGDIEVCWLISRGKGDFGNTSREDALAKIQSLGSSDLLALTLLGTLHNMIGLFKHDTPFTLVETAGGPITPPAGSEVIPMNQMRELFEDHVQHNPLFKSLVDAAPCPVLHFFPPPPKEFFAASGKSRVIDGRPVRLEYAAAPSRVALWKLEAAIASAYLAGLSVHHYSMPEGSATRDGFLAPAYHAKDATHANSAYGELLLRDFEHMLHHPPVDP